MERKLKKSFLGVVFGLLALTAIVGTAYAMNLQSWDERIDNPTARFQILSKLNNEAVLDRETGLVWELDAEGLTFTGDPEIDTGIDSWSIAAFKCIRKAVGGRKGWRLPSVHELATLVDMSVSADEIRLPPGHPFLNIGTDFYWTATSQAADTTRAWVVRFLGGGVVTDDKDNPHPFWCVRGSSPGPDAY